MSRPTSTDYPDFATNTNYAAGPYAGNPNKAKPSAGVIGEGLNPGAGMPTEWVNWLFNRAGQWTKWFLTLPTTASDAPQYQYQDAAGNTRAVFDHNGFMIGGRNSQFREEWAYITDPSIPPQTRVIWTGTPWTYDVATAGAINVQAPSSSYNARYLQLTPTTSVAAATALWGPTLFVANTAGMSCVMECEVGLNAAAAGTSSKVDFWWGLDDGTDDPGSTSNVISLYKAAATSTYQLLTMKASSVVATATTASPTAGTFPTDRLRIEIQGSASAYGAYQARFFVNSVLVGTVAASLLPGSVGLRPVFSAYTDLGAPVGSPLMYVGPLTVTWNRYAAGSTL